MAGSGCGTAATGAASRRDVTHEDTSTILPYEQTFQAILAKGMFTIIGDGHEIHYMENSWASDSTI